jgi:Ca2+-binding RTX toxin-like protein
MLSFRWTLRKIFCNLRKNDKSQGKDMATTEVFNDDGSLQESVNEINDSVGPYASVPLENRLEGIINGLISFNQAVRTDYRQGGFLNYGIRPDGVFRVELDNYNINFEGAFSTAGSYVDKVSIYEISSTTLVNYEGDFYYSGLPFFTNFSSTGLYESIGITDAKGTAIARVNALETTTGFVEGYIESWFYGFDAPSGNGVTDLVAGGDVYFTAGSGGADVKSGEFRSASVTTFAPGSTDIVLNSITTVNTSIPLAATSADFDIFSAADKVTLTGKFGSTIYTSTGDDEIIGSVGDDSIYGQAGNDTLEGGKGNDLLDGGVGTDVARYGLTQSAIEGAKTLSDGSTEIRTTLGTDILVSIETLQFADGTLSINELVNDNPTPFFDTSNGPVAADIYDGPVSFLEFQLIVTDSNDVITGSDRNDFINLLGGDDAADGGAGRDVLDGGNGSNFLTGGADADTFFSDGRGGETTWTTITDFTNVDNLNIWGWQDGVSQLIAALEDQGAEGFKGATFHYDLNGDETIDTSVTFANLQLDELASPTTQEVAGNGYVLFLLDSVGAVPTYVEADPSVVM